MTLLREACLIGGEWITNGKWIEVDNPATGAIIGRVPDLGPEHVARAIRAADAAMAEWRRTTGKHRAEVLKTLHRLMLDNRDELGALITQEQGKPLAEAKGEIDYAAAFIEWFAEEAKRAYGEIIPAPSPDRRLLVVRQPVGVTGMITPWNFPSAMLTRKIAPALAAGCGIVAKPAEQTPFSALALGVLAQQAGVPDGLLNIVTGDAVSIGRALTDSPVVRKISFTGSTQVGVKLFRQSAPTIKKLSLELGGNAPFLVFDDADLDAAVEGAMVAKFRNAGQTCVCANRIYAQAGIYEEFVVRLGRAMEDLQTGPGDDPDSTIGPLIDGPALEKVQAHVADAKAKGGRVLIGGARHAAGARFHQPTLIADATADMLLAKEETFGPVAAVFRFEKVDEAIAMANDTEYGLAAYFYSRDLGRVWRVAEALEAGMVGINSGLISTEVAPFGGIKASGLGREGSRHGLADYEELKYLHMSL